MLSEKLSTNFIQVSVIKSPGNHMKTYTMLSEKISANFLQVSVIKSPEKGTEKNIKILKTLKNIKNIKNPVNWYLMVFSIILIYCGTYNICYFSVTNQKIPLNRSIGQTISF
jgi:hypothetical protein